MQIGVSRWPKTVALSLPGTPVDVRVKVLDCSLRKTRERSALMLVTIHALLSWHVLLSCIVLLPYHVLLSACTPFRGLGSDMQIGVSRWPYTSSTGVPGGVDERESLLILPSSKIKLPQDIPAIDCKGFETRAIHASVCQAARGYFTHRKQPPLIKLPYG